MNPLPMKTNAGQTALLAFTVLLASCQMPLVLQDPGVVRSPEWETQGRFRGAEPPATEVYDEGLQRVAEAARTHAEPGYGAPTGVTAESGWGGAGRAQQAPGATPTETREARHASRDAEDPLYAWDGGVVSQPEAGIQHDASPSTRGLEPSLQGRMHILELYQEVLDERDTLQNEVDALRAALARTRDAEEQMSAESERTRREMQELLAAQAKLQAENRELLARLTTAQIRRLETEKLLLETQIAWHDERSAASAASAATTQASYDRARSGRDSGSTRP